MPKHCQALQCGQRAVYVLPAITLNALRMHGSASSAAKVTAQDASHSSDQQGLAGLAVAGDRAAVPAEQFGSPAVRGCWQINTKLAVASAEMCAFISAMSWLRLQI
jgi:hypothetical protein